MTMMSTKTFAQSYGEEGPTLSRNALGLVYEGAIEKNVPGKVNIQKVSYMVDGIKAVAKLRQEDPEVAQDYEKLLLLIQN